MCLRALLEGRESVGEHVWNMYESLAVNEQHGNIKYSPVTVIDLKLVL